MMKLFVDLMTIETNNIFFSLLYVFNYFVSISSKHHFVNLFLVKKMIFVCLTKFLHLFLSDCPIQSKKPPHVNEETFRINLHLVLAVSFEKRSRVSHKEKLLIRKHNQFPSSAFLEMLRCVGLV